MEKEAGISEGIFWIGIAVVICILALHFDLGSFRAPGAGFVAFLAGIFIGAMGAVMIASKALSARRAKDARRTAAPPVFTTHGRLAYTLILLLLYAVLMDPLGFILSTALAMFFLFFDTRRKNWFWSAFFSVVTTLTSYFVFEIWLRCQLPRGILPWW
jgi:hypothetical protein